jgi:hypothetical protein
MDARESNPTPLSKNNHAGYNAKWREIASHYFVVLNEEILSLRST